LNDSTSLAIRNYRPGDEAQWLALLRAAPDFPYSIFNRSPSLDALRVLLEHPYMDAARNLFFAESGGGLAGYAELWHAPGGRRAVVRVLVHPAWRRQGLRTGLLRAAEARARELGAQYLDIQIESLQEGGRAFLEARDFRPVHQSWQMVMCDLAGAAQPVWPSGYGVRSFIVGEDEAVSRHLENESFADEWEYVPVAEGEIEGFVRSPSFRADGVTYAVHDEQVVGECWSWMDEQGIAQSGEKQGDIWCLCVHPRHRGRGLGRALLLAGVQWLRQQGMAGATLYVDGANDRARHLYDSVGFVAARTDIWYREEL
jgi:mycothiol synthase